MRNIRLYCVFSHRSVVISHVYRFERVARHTAAIVDDMAVALMGKRTERFEIIENYNKICHRLFHVRVYKHSAFDLSIAAN